MCCIFVSRCVLPTVSNHVHHTVVEVASMFVSVSSIPQDNSLYTLPIMPMARSHRLLNSRKDGESFGVIFEKYLPASTLFSIARRFRISGK